MNGESQQEAVNAAMRRINQAWLDGQVDALGPLVHPEIVTVFPGFAGRVQGRETFLSGFRDFCLNAKIHEFQESDLQADVIADTAVVTFRYKMLYERGGDRYEVVGRDLWAFHKSDDAWVAIWRTMLDVDEKAA